MIFVFGSNLDGIHAGGAARYAHQQRGAVMGVGEGLTGECYALPTLGHGFGAMQYFKLASHVSRFLVCAYQHPKLTFQVTRVGCGIAGFSDEEVAALFEAAPPNCQFDEVWRPYLPTATFWGTF